MTAERVRPMTFADVPAVALQEAFSFGEKVTPAAREEYLTRRLPWPLESVGRVLEVAGAVRASGLWYPFPVALGERTLASASLAAVATDSTWRRRGAANRLVREGLAEFRDKGVPLSILYAFRPSFYRRLGYGLYPGYHKLELPLRLLPEAGAPPARIVGREASTEELFRVYDACARRNQGWIARDPDIWRTKHLEPHPPRTAEWLLLGEPASPWAYCALEGKGHLLHVIEWGVAGDPWLPGLLAFWRTLGDQFEQVSFCAPAEASLASLLEEPGSGRMERITHRLAEVGYGPMLRFLRLEESFAARPYPPGIAARLAIEVLDPIFPENTGRFVLEVEGGAGQLSRGGSGEPDLVLPVDRLASIFAGALDPARAARWGLLRGSASGLAAARALFAEPPWFCWDVF